MRINRRVAALGSLVAISLSTETARAQTATQTVTFSVVPTSRVVVSASTAPTTVTRRTSNAAQTSASMSGASYGITTNEPNQKIAAAIEQAMPAGVTLAVSLAAPTGAVSAGSRILGTLASDVVTGIAAVSASALPIVYTLNAPAAAAPMAARSRVVTFTITAGQ
jgi:phage-related minor tail protein